MSAIQKAETDRQLIELEVNRLDKKVKDAKNPSLGMLSALEKKQSELETDLVEIHRRIMHQMPSAEDSVNHLSVYNGLADRLLDISITISELQHSIKAKDPPRVESNQQHQQPQKTNVRLPVIELPPFTGNYADWLSFSDLFKAMIDKRTDLSSAQKLQYLKKATENIKLVSAITITDDNYDIAWKLLEERYNNSREIAMSIMNRLFSQPHLHRESAADIQKLMDTTNECLQSLKALGRPTSEWDDVIVYIIVQRLDAETRKQWALQLTGTDIPNLKKLFSFLEQYCRGLQASSTTSINKGHSSHEKRHSSHYSSNSNGKCPLCKEFHRIYKCSIFISATPEERSKMVRKHKYCSNCLQADHFLVKECRSSERCKHCSLPHNSLLHYGRTTQKQQSHSSNCTTVQPDSQSAKNATAVHSHFSSLHARSQVILGTALARVQDSSGQSHSVRILLDSASQCTMITDRVAQALGLKRHVSNVVVNGVGKTKAGHSRGEVQLTLHSTHNDYSINIEAVVLGTVSDKVPNYRIKDKSWNHLHGLQLADPEYYNPADIDILLDADYTEEIMLKGKRSGSRFSPKAYNTQFGWVLTGRVQVLSHAVQVNHVHCELETLVKNFWQLEQIPDVVHLTAEQLFCEEHFRDSFQRDKTGRFILQLPFNERLSELGASRDIAIRRFLQVERRLNRNPAIKKEYCDFMKEYETLGHMEVISPSAEREIIGKTNYLPHHFVIKSDSTTTRLRVVFDGSAKTSTGVSLNDTLSVGATVQNDLFAILLNFRLHPIVVKADIAKMFRQFLVEDSHCDYQRIVWRESSDQPIRHYKLKTITYGINSSPFLSTRCLQQLAVDNEAQFPLAAPVLRSNTYVDDSIPGALTVEHGITLIQEHIQVCASAGLTLRKFCSNNAAVLRDIPVEYRETETSFDLDKSAGVKALGVKWNNVTDSLHFSVHMNTPHKLTKRSMLSELAKVFDPLGLISPVTVVGKILFQRLWKIDKLGWESMVPNDIANEWNEYKQNLVAIEQCAINRCVLPIHNTYHELHGFSDASEAAYGACVYIRYRGHDQQFKANMITSKVRVAPLKRLSIERLELCGATLLSELMSMVYKTFNLNCPRFAWTDSTIVLRYIAAHPSRWKTFIAHKVAKIQETLPVEHWRHVKGVENPADLISRGVPAFKLNSSLLWWQGPVWLAAEHVPLSSPLPVISSSVKLEERKKAFLTAHVVIDTDMITKYSSLLKLKRVTAYVLRFLDRAKTFKKSRDPLDNHQVPVGPLTPAELQRALTFWIKRVQQQEYKDEIKKITFGKPVKNKSQLLSLNPFLDKEGVLRVGGRLNNATIPEDQKHQIILPHSSHLSKLIIRCVHLTMYHSGAQLTSQVQQQYWITRSRSAVKDIIRKCVTCRRHKAVKTQQLMGSLPAPRVTPAPPFCNTGIDYAGPFHLVPMKGRKKQTFKGYFAIFVCLCTKAVHLEAVSDMTTETFIAALKRFISRRGVCLNIYTDCGTNFVGAERELKQLLQSSGHNTQIADHLSSTGVTWHFNTPGSPHQGGLWEAGVKSVKFHFRRVVGETKLTFEEFQTILCQIEAILNSRPICGVSTDPTDLNLLTPGHFLVGRPLTALPEPELTHLKTSRLSRWQLCQQLTQHFWNRWRNEYLTMLQQRFKWNEKRDNLRIGDLVLINDENLPPIRWKLGRIIDVKAGKDNCVRTVSIKTMTGVYERSVSKLTPILCTDEKE